MIPEVIGGITVQ